MQGNFMRFTSVLFSFLLLFACQSGQRGDVWKNYEWLPPGAESSNPYVMPEGNYRGYGGYPTYDNDSDYVQPYGWGMCGGANNLGNCE